MSSAEGGMPGVVVVMTILSRCQPPSAGSQLSLSVDTEPLAASWIHVFRSDRADQGVNDRKDTDATEHRYRAGSRHANRIATLGGQIMVSRTPGRWVGTPVRGAV